MMEITVNDEARRLPVGATVADLVAALGLAARRVAVEVNRAIVPRASYAEATLHDGDTVEVIHFVGGG
jgi:thiamine biosynthesis protein ThiS